MELSKLSPETKVFTNPEEELKYLRAEISKRERELEERGQLTPKAEVAKSVLDDYQEQPSSEVLHPHFTLPAQEVEEIVLNLKPELHDDKMSELLGLIQTKGVKNTLVMVDKLANPHLTDDFHRFLVAYLVSGYPVLGLKQKSALWKTFQMTLYEITLPLADKQEPAKPLRELLSSMEQFYAGMLSIKDLDDLGPNHFTLEIAVANQSDEFIFYAAVPTARKNLFEKQLLAIFPLAQLVPAPDDYNIFNADGVSVGAYAKLDRSAIYPLKTYDNFDYDPLNILLNSFSKTNRQGEGAAIQLVFKPTGDHYAKQYRHTLDQLNRGVGLKEALPAETLWSEFSRSGLVKDVQEFFFPEKSSKTSEPKESKSKPVDQSVVKLFEEKVASPIATVNLRLIASGPSRGSTEAILADMEASFNQFSNSGGNKLAFVRPTGSKLDALLKSYSFRDFDFHHSLPLNLKEVVSVAHLPTTGRVPTSQLKQSKAGQSAPPTGLLDSGLLLGVNRYQQKETKIFMSAEDRLRHFYVIGQTGTGKTTLLKNMIAQDIATGEGVCFIDPHGNDVEEILSYIPQNRYEDLTYFDPSHTARPIGLNMLEFDPDYPEQKTFVVNEMISIFNKLFDMKTVGGPMFEQYFRNAVLLIMEDPASGNTLLDVSRVLADKRFRELKLSRCRNPIVLQFWREVAEKAGGEAALSNIVPYITSKFDIFLSNDIMRPIVVQEKSSLNFRQIMDEKKILLVNLSKGRLGDINAHLIGLIIVGKILMAALSRIGSQSSAVPAFYLYIDEFQNVTTDSIATILSEARKYKLGLTVAHQFIAQLEENIRDAVFGNVGSMAAFRVGATDAEHLVKQFEPIFSTTDLMNLDNRHAYLRLLVNGRPVKPFDIETLAPPPGISVEALASLKQLSYAKHGSDRAVVEEAIMLKYKN